MTEQYGDLLNRLMVQAVIKRLGNKPYDVLIFHSLLQATPRLIFTEAASTYIQNNIDQIAAVLEMPGSRKVRRPTND